MPIKNAVLRVRLIAQLTSFWSGAAQALQPAQRQEAAAELLAAVTNAACQLEIAFEAAAGLAQVAGDCLQLYGWSHAVYTTLWAKKRWAPVLGSLPSWLRSVTLVTHLYTFTL